MDGEWGEAVEPGAGAAGIDLPSVLAQLDEQEPAEQRAAVRRIRTAIDERSQAAAYVPTVPKLRALLERPAIDFRDDIAACLADLAAQAPTDVAPSTGSIVAVAVGNADEPMVEDLLRCLATVAAERPDVLVEHAAAITEVLERRNGSDRWGFVYSHTSPGRTRPRSNRPHRFSSMRWRRTRSKTGRPRSERSVDWRAPTPRCPPSSSSHRPPRSQITRRRVVAIRRDRLSRRRGPPRSHRGRASVRRTRGGAVLRRSRHSRDRGGRGQPRRRRRRNRRRPGSRPVTRVTRGRPPARAGERLRRARSRSRRRGRPVSANPRERGPGSNVRDRAAWATRQLS